jgi:acyl carrier protein
MIPSAFVVLDALPLSPNGKIDRRALPAPTVAFAAQGTAAKLQTATEAALAAIWAEILGVKQIGRHDNFFDLGGHSLLATRLVYRVQETFSVPLSIHRLFTSPTVAEIAREIERIRQSNQRSPAVMARSLPAALVAL